MGLGDMAKRALQKGKEAVDTAKEIAKEEYNLHRYPQPTEKFDYDPDKDEPEK